MKTRKVLLAGLTLAALLAAPPSSYAAKKWTFFGLGGGDVPAATVNDGTIELAQATDPNRINRIEAQMRSLTGQVEELTYQLRQLQALLERMQEDADFRFRQLEGGNAVARPAAEAQPEVQPLPEDTEIVLQPLPDETTGEQLGAPPAPLGTLTLDAPLPGEQPLDLSSLAGGGDAAATTRVLPSTDDTQLASLATTGDPRADYDQAYQLINAGQYDIAEKAFRQFLDTYPTDELAPEAQYWLGESLFAHGDFATAAEEFKAGYQSYPKSKRAPDSLLKLGLSMAGLGYRDEACKMYALAVKQYPQMPNGLRQRVKNEQASAAC